MVQFLSKYSPFSNSTEDFFKSENLLGFKSQACPRYYKFRHVSWHLAAQDQLIIHSNDKKMVTIDLSEKNLILRHSYNLMHLSLSQGENVNGVHTIFNAKFNLFLMAWLENLIFGVESHIEQCEKVFGFNLNPANMHSE